MYIYYIMDWSGCSKDMNRALKHSNHDFQKCKSFFAIYIIIYLSGKIIFQNVTTAFPIVYACKRSIIRSWSYNIRIYSPLCAEVSFQWTLVIPGIKVYDSEYPEYYSPYMCIWTRVNINLFLAHITWYMVMIFLFIATVFTGK